MKIIKFLLKSLVVIVLLIVIALIVVSFKSPKLDRNWSEESKILPDITISSSTLKVDNLRDWRYASGTVVYKDYYNENFDLDKIEKVYFLVNPFGKWQGVGHTFFVFEFSDGKSVSVSVEARREVGEEYGAIIGLFNTFEMWYAWGSPADFMSRRAIYHNEDLYMYPLLVSTSTARNLFIDLAKTTEDLETKADFYNTVNTNCTNVLADSANRVNKGSIPWNWARIFTGFADDELYNLKLIPHGKTFEEINKEARVDEQIRELFKESKEVYKDKFWEDLSGKI